MASRLTMVIVLALACAAPSGAAEGPGAPPRNDGASWPTLHGDLMRSGFYPAFPKGPLKLVWRKELHQELTGPRAEVIVGQGLAFMGTYAGRMYAWDSATGQQTWVLRTSGPIGHSPALDGGVLYFGSMDRRLYAVNAVDGGVKWRFEAGEGIWTSPLVHAGLVMFGARDGVFYALNQADGKLAWKHPTAAPILGSASISEDGQRVLFASEDMHLHCLALRDGKLLWKSRKMAGLSARDYFPVIVGGLALVTTNPVREFHYTLGTHENMLLERTGFTGKDKRYIPGAPQDLEKEQDFILEFLKKDPSQQTFYAFNVADGQEPWVAPVLYTSGLHNPHGPPCHNPRTGEVYVLLRTAYGMWDGGGEVRSYTGVAKLDLKTGRVSLVEHAHRSKDPSRPPGQADMPWMTFNLIGDETQILSCSLDMLFSNHQGYLGSLNLKTGLTANQYGKRDTYGGFYGPGNFGWENQGGYDKAKAAGQPYGIVNEWHGPAKAIVSVAGQHVYFPVGSQVICLKGAP